MESQDNAEYHCQAKNKAGTTSSRKAKFTVEKGADKTPPVFEKPLVAASVIGGDAVRLEVHVTGVPNPHVTWLKDGKPLDDARLVAKDEGSGDHSLTIRRTQESDAGEYSVVAKNSTGEATTVAKLDIQQPQQPTIEGISDKEVEFLTPAVFEVTVSGVPTPTVHWLKDGKEIASDDNVMISVSDSTHKLAIRRVAESNTGHYNIQASNSAGVAGAQANLTISPRAPAFSSGANDYIANMGAPLTIDVKVSGYPAPTVTITRNGVPVKFEQSGDNYRIPIAAIGEGDIGDYTITAISPSGTITADFKVKIQEQPPSLLKNLPKTVDILGGEVLRLEGRVAGTPPPDTKWFKDGVEVIVDGDRITIERKADGTVILTIRDSTPADAGRYELVATNSKGENRSSSRVGVTAKRVPLSERKRTREEFRFDSRSQYVSHSCCILL